MLHREANCFSGCENCIFTAFDVCNFTDRAHASNRAIPQVQRNALRTLPHIGIAFNIVNFTSNGNAAAVGINRAANHVSDFSAGFHQKCTALCPNCARWTNFAFR